MREGWEPILDAGARTTAAAALRSLADALGAAHLAHVYGGSLSRGVAGVALFYAYFAAATADEDLRAHAARYLSSAADVLSSSGTQDLTLFRGATGILWATDHLLSGPSAIQERAGAIDAQILARLEDPDWRGPFDLVDGLVGYAVYALEARGRASARSVMERVVARLREVSTATSDRPAWWTGPDAVSGASERLYPRGYVSYGLAHGAPGAIGVLGRLLAAGITPDSTRSLLEATIRWMLDQRLPDTELSTFGTLMPIADKGRASLRRSRRASRLAWCYGDLGVAVAIYTAAVHLAAPQWQAEALVMARRAARRELAGSGVEDPGLCHGAAGVAHLFNRLYQATREAIFGDAARFWFAQTLSYYQPGSGLGGFSARRESIAPGHSPWWPWPGLLEGSAGVGLALLAATTTIEPEWDRALLMGMPVAPRLPPVPPTRHPPATAR